MKMQDTLSFTIPFYDVDSMRVVWHGNYVKYMENGRCAFLKKIGMSYEFIEDSGYFLPVVSMNLKFIRPARSGQRVLLISELEDCNNLIIFHYLLQDEENGTKLMKGETRQMAVDKNTGKSFLVLPDLILNKIKELREKEI